MAKNIKNDIVVNAGINPKTLLSNFFYGQKLESYIATVLILPFLIFGAVAVFINGSDSSPHIPVWLEWVGFISLGGIGIGGLYSLWAVYAVPKLYAWRVRIFAARNKLHLLPQSKLIEFIPDSIHHADVQNVHAAGCALSVGNQQITVFDYTCLVGTGKHKALLVKGLAVLQLKGNYPDLFLDSKKNGKNHQYSASQKVELEGGFSKYFDLYMPEGSQAGSLTVFAPDMMQTILDTGKLFDVEIKGNQAVIISDELVFTRKTLPIILGCAAALSKEFKQLDRSWQPVFTPNGREYKLNGQPLWRILLLSFIPIIVGVSINLLNHNFLRPRKAHPSPLTVVETNKLYNYNRDAATLAVAYQIADKLNVHTATNPVPASLAQAHITNTLPTITYTKLLPDTYQFCATYSNYINGNGPTGASGNIVAYYGATVDSANLPQTLQIVEWHNQGKNCQVVRPVLK